MGTFGIEGGGIRKEGETIYHKRRTGELLLRDENHVLWIKVHS